MGFYLLPNVKEIILTLWPNLRGSACNSLLGVVGRYCAVLLPPTRVTVAPFTLSPNTFITILLFPPKAHRWMVLVHGGAFMKRFDL